MSLILDALKKLEREKQTAPRGFLVVAPGPWEGSGRGASLVAGALLVGLVLGAFSLFTYGRWARGETAVPAAAPPPTLAAAVSTVAPPSSLAPAPPVRPRDVPRPPRDRAPAVAPPSSLTSPAPASTADEGPRLQAISEQDGHPVAVIDEHMVREGDEVAGMKILRIGTAEVEIEQLGRRRVLRF